MIDAVFICCFGIGYLSNFAVVKSLHKVGGCLVSNNTFFF